MSQTPSHSKLTLTLLRVQGKQVEHTHWTTTGDLMVIGAAHPLFAQYDAKEFYVGDKHLELFYVDGCWQIKSIHNSFSCTLDGQKLSFNKAYPLRNNSIIEIGLCQICVSDHQSLNDTDELKKLLLLDDLASTGLSDNNIALSDPQRGAVHHIGQAHLEDKTTFEDLGLGTHFDEQSFFREVQSDSSRLSALKAGTTGKSTKDLDVLDQLAIESELAIINPSLLSKNTDYWRGQTTQDFINNQPIPELAHLFAIDNHRQERMLPLDNLTNINALLASSKKIDQAMPDLTDVDDYELFSAETNVEPLRLFSLQHQELRAHIPNVTPEFTQKEHHTSSMDGHFSVPNVERSRQTTSGKINSTTKEASLNSKDDWLNNFSASLGDKVSSDEILNALKKAPPKPAMDITTEQ
ncbi:TagK domain-containing protein [Hydromonas duriensis]|uniref:FHA domain-containing protein n=1 Tax=Hydromonas duriensis TaxID=1527608 RepID=A0A4R6YBL8_9BURK|nr:TagK domain-containing protein [Hydromonas duriensis]TDR33056.1 hypothetical protein DFR44_101106 [Hydromonas duriensis]